MTEGLVRRGFDIDLPEMAAFEGDLIRVLRDRGTVRIEHKRDFITVRTGNLFVEYEQPSGRSGILTTTADSWAFEYDDNTWLIVPTKILKQACARAFKQGRLKAGGDGNRYLGLLVPIKWLVPPYLHEAGPYDPR